MAKETTEQQRMLLEHYETYVREVLQPTQLELTEVLKPWVRPEYWQKYQRTNRLPIPSPVKATFTRIKRPEQVVDKIFRKPHKFPEGLQPISIRRMLDAIGVRVLVYFLSHLPLVDRELRSSEMLEVSETDPPVAYLGPHNTEVLSLDHLEKTEKPSGYCSIHYTLRLKNSRVPKEKRPWFELQLRTVTMDLWCTLEHHLGYKPTRATHFAAKQQFKILSQHLAAVDEHFNFLSDELNRYQSDVSYEGSDILGPENLPSVLADVSLACAQRDINNIIKFLSARGVETVHALRLLATPNRLGMIRNTYLSVTGREPHQLEVIATLAALQGAENVEEEITRIKNQIAYRGAWEAIQQDYVKDQD